MKRIAVYAGSFDPPTLGHLYMMQQGAALFDELIVVAAVNPDKKGFFTPAQRRLALDSMLQQLPANVRIHELHQGFLAEYAHSIGATHLLRGVRNTIDFEYEKTMARVNAQMVPQLQTVFLTPSPECENISSSLVRGLIGQPNWEQWVRPLVTPTTFTLIQNLSN